MQIYEGITRDIAQWGRVNIGVNGVHERHTVQHWQDVCEGCMWVEKDARECARCIAWVKKSVQRNVRETLCDTGKMHRKVPWGSERMCGKA